MSWAKTVLLVSIGCGVASGAEQAATSRATTTQVATISTTTAPATTAPAVSFEEAEKAIEKLTVADGLKISAWAADSQLANPVAIWMDEKGRAWVAETY